MRARVLRFTLCSNSIFELLDEVTISLYLFSSSISLIRHFRGRLRGRSETAVYFFAFFARVISSTFSVLYTEKPSNLIRLLLECFFCLFKSCFYYLICLRNNTISALYVSYIRLI